MEGEDWWSECFVTQNQHYCLIDGGGDIRATSHTLEGIVGAKKYFGWGTIHKYNFDGKILKIGKVVI